MTDPGQHVLPGADLGREVPLPPQPPLEDEAVNYCTNGACDHVYERDCSPLCVRREVESPDLPIPAEAIEAMCDLSYLGKQITESHAKYLLAAALPHLRSLQVETQIEFGRALGRREALEEAERAVLAVRDAEMSLSEVMATSMNHELTKAAKAVRALAAGGA